jgi:hypothetical protein
MFPTATAFECRTYAVKPKRANLETKGLIKDDTRRTS